MYWLLTRLLPIRLIAAVALVVIALSMTGIDVTGIALDLLGVPDWRWTGLDLLPW